MQRGGVPTTVPHADLSSAFTQVLPSAAIITDVEARQIAASDIAFEALHLPACILAPKNEEEVAAIVSVARAEGISLYPRGGGWSYTKAHLPQSSHSAIVDTAGLTGITFGGDAVVEAGAGVTWSELHQALAAHGQRVPSFGPLSGISAQIGSTLANDGAFFGGAGYGAIGEKSVAAVTMVDGCGKVQWLTPEDRYDSVLAPQPLAGDCGAFGIKTKMRLSLMPIPEKTRFASFAFVEGSRMVEAMVRLRDLPGLGEVYAFNHGVHENLVAGGFSVLEASSDIEDGEGASDWITRLPGLKTARAKRANLGDIPWALHISIDGDRKASEEVRTEIARRIASFGGEAIPDVIPRVTRAKPFRAIKALVTPKGERWLSCHGLVEAAEGAALLKSVESVLADSTDDQRAASVRSGFLVSLIGRRITVEPQLYWRDSLSRYLRSKVTPEQAQRFGDAPDNAAGRALAYQLRENLIAVMDKAGAGHFQIGRTYAAQPNVPKEVLDLWRRLKRRFDPDRIMNPGVLGV